MCGIAGISKFDGSRVAPSEVRALGDALKHRGPDDMGYLGHCPGASPSVARTPDATRGAMTALVHLRLSILDLSPAGFQPMGSADGRYWIVFNGEVYNYLELRRELQALGYSFHTQTDTEVLLAALMQWGKPALRRLVGMFAFALLDTRDNHLLLARDFFGIKPLLYRWDDRQFAFASELKALLSLPRAPRQIQPQRLFEYLRFGLTDHGGQTLLEGYHQLPAAHYLEISLEQPAVPTPVRYWQPDLACRSDLSFDEAAKQLRELFLKSVDLHLRSDVPVGACLSGGIDSSSIVSAMRHVKGNSLNLSTFSYVAEEPELSEEKWADLASQAVGAQIFKTRPNAEELLDDLRRIVELQDEPFTTTSIYAQYKVFQLTHRHGVKVVLDGQGADELLGGYSNYQGARFASLIRQQRWGDACRFWKAATASPHGRSLLFYAGEFLLPSRLQSPFRYWLGKDLVPAWIEPSWFIERGVSLVSPRSLSSRFQEELAHSIGVNLLPLLRYEDRNSMAFSIESRVPFLTPEMVNFVLSLPEEYIIAPDGTSKAIFRRAMRGLVPDAILDRRDKVGFQTPERRWLRALQPWVEKTFQSQAARRIPALRPMILAAASKASLQGRQRFDGQFWRCLNLIHWSEIYQVQF